MTDEGDEMRPPARLRTLASWQASKTSTLGARLTSTRMPLSARADFAILAALEEYGPLSQAELGRRLGLDRNDVNAILNRLQPSQHVDRGVDPGDRRRNIVALTDTGHRHLEQLQLLADAVQDELLRGLSVTERRQLHMLLEKLLSSHQGQPA